MRLTSLMVVALCLSGAATLAPAAAAPAKTQTIQYQSGGKTVEGFLAVPKSGGTHPGIVVIHEWWGLTPWVREQTRKLAGQGYVAMAVDLYRGRSTTNPAEARQLARSLPHDRALQDLEAAFNYLASRPDVEKDKIGSIGWCMGGGWSLQLAEHEPKLAACVVNYGELPTDSAAIESIRAPVLGNFGADDRGIPPQAVQAFEQRMKTDRKQINLKIYAGAGHAFQNPDNKKGYRPAAAEDAWRRTVAFFTRELK